MAFIRVSIDAPSLAYAVSLFRQQFSSSSVPTASTQAKACLFAFQPINATVLAQLLLFVKSPKTRHNFPSTRTRMQKKSVTRVFPLRRLILRAHEAAYLYLVSLWQLDLERAESRGPPAERRTVALKK